MRRREEKRRKFHEAVLNILYPPPPSPPKQENEEEEEEEVVNTLQEGFMVDSIPVPDDLEETGCGSTSSSDDLETGPQKLTRAQRKRLRKKKLIEAASQRRKIIGPLLPSTSDELGSSGGDVLENEPPSVRQNATETPNAAIDQLGGETPPPNCSNHNKLKHRRKAKIQAREKTKSSCMEQSNQDSQPCEKHENSN